MADDQDNPYHDAWLAGRAVTLAEIAEQLTGKDAGSVLFDAALLAWAKTDGSDQAIVKANIALANVTARPPSRRQ